MLKNKKGFTLIELLIVITIIGILAVAFLPSLLGAPAKARDVQRMADAQKIAGAVTTYTIGSTLPPAGICLAGTTPTDSWKTIIKDEDFGGKSPTDPTKLGTGTASTCAAGYAIVVGNKNGGSPYSAGIFTRVETINNANVDCESIPPITAAATDAWPPILASADALALDSSTKYCYGILLQ